MKTLFKVLGALVALVLLALILLPVLLKDSLVESLKEEVNKNLNAEVNFGDFDLSLISTFPDLKFSIKDVQVSGVDTFKGIQLLNIALLETEVDLMSVIGGDEMKINNFGIDGLDARIIVLEDGTANYDIAPESEEVEEEEEEESSEETSFNLNLKKYYFRNINLVYEDREADMYAEIKELNHEGNGDFSMDDFILNTITSIKSLTYKMDGIAYLNKVNLNSKFDIGMDMVNSKYSFDQNTISLNDLDLNFDGFVAMPTDDIEMDLSFNAPSTDFKTTLSLIPAVYMRDFEQLKTAGSFKLQGMAKGTYTDESLPAFDLALQVDDAMFQYPELPSKVDQIQVDLKVSNPGGSEDNTVIDLKQFAMKVAENPINMNLYMTNPVSDPNMKGLLQSQFNLASLGEVIPLEEGENYQGSVTADLNFEGKLSSIEEERYDEFNATGKLILLDYLYEDSTLGCDVLLKKAYLNFSPNDLDLSTFELQMGKSDLKGSGKISNYLPYYFHDSTLLAGLNLQSEFMDIDELMGPETEETTEEEAVEGTESESDAVEDSAYVIEVPSNIEFSLKMNVKKMLYDGMEIENTQGMISTKNAVAYLDKFRMETLGGAIVMNGSYDTRDIEKPSVDFKLDIQKLDVPMSFETFNTVKKLAPIAESATGAFSTELDFVCILDQNMEPLMNTLTGGGKMQTHNVVIDGSQTLKKAAKVLKNDKYAKIDLENVNISYEFKDGRLFIEPFDIKWADSKANISGSNGFDMSLDYLIKMEIPSDDLGSAFAEASSMLADQAKSAGLNIGGGDKVKMNLKITGTADDPMIRPVLAGTDKASLKDAAKDELLKQKAELEKKAREEAERLKKEAEEKARQEAERLKKEAEEKAKKEAERLKKEAEERARKEAERLKKEAEEKAKKEAEQKLKEKGSEELKNLLKKR